jgi:DNA-binding MarR family transcriptional regulator
MSSSAPQPTTRHFDSLPQEAFLNLWRTYERLKEFEDELFSQFDLTPQQYNILRLLKGAQPEALPTLALASKLVSQAPDITRMLDKLEQHGWISRHRPAENRRLVLVSITDVGLKLVKQIDKPLRECHQRQLGHLSAKQLTQLVALLHAARAPHEPPDGAWK